MIVKGITIHNTGNKLSANELYSILLKNKKINITHFIVDEKEIIEVYPVDKEASHTGKGYDYGNKNTIAIEIARSECDDNIYFEAQKNAISLIKRLMKKYNLTKNDIYFHNDFNQQTYCPHRILKIYKTKEEFINGCII